MNTKYRKMVVDDLPAVFAVRLSTIENAVTRQELAEDYGITPQSLAEVMNSHVSGWLCEVSETVVGFSMGDRLTGEVQVLAVTPGYEGNGIGKTLLARVTSWLFDAGHDEVWLCANPDPTLRAYGFYRQLGWRAPGTMKGDDEIMTLRKPTRG